ncbi:unnamed protein product [Prorocentrum cordatum]|uniref:Uncharacterized protein n=1 Tax=Prorocentrum cordatum TaxID=2364126 RepID=A0ABN9TSQ9_9DINO|nr:unnamed protein product [Polarella glacialis]
MAEAPHEDDQPPPKDVCVQYNGEEYDWPALSGSQDIAVFQENILHYFRVPIERQAIYSHEGPVLTSDDVARELLRDTPRFSVYDRGGSSRRNLLSELVTTGDGWFDPPALATGGTAPPGFPDAAGAGAGQHAGEVEDLGTPRPCARGGPTEPAADEASGALLLPAPLPAAPFSALRSQGQLPGVPEGPEREPVGERGTLAEVEQQLADRTRLELGALERATAMEAAMELQQQRLADLEGSLQVRRQGQLQDEAALARVEQQLSDRTRLELGALERATAMEAAMELQQQRLADLEGSLQVRRQGQLQEEAALARVEQQLSDCTRLELGALERATAMEAAMELQQQRLADLEGSLQVRRQGQLQEEAALARVEQQLSDRTRLELGALERTTAMEAAMELQQQRLADLEGSLQVRRQGQLQEEAALARVESTSLAACREAEQLRLEVQELRGSAGRAADSLRQEVWEAREECGQERMACQLRVERQESEAEWSIGALERSLNLLEEEQAAQQREDQQRCQRLEAQVGQSMARAATLLGENDDLRTRMQGHEQQERDLEATCQEIRATCRNLEAAQRQFEATPAMGDEGAMLCREFELQVQALRGRAQQGDAQLHGGQEARAEELMEALRRAEDSGSRVLGEARAEEAQAAQDMRSEMERRLSAAREELRQREQDYRRHVGELEASLRSAVGAMERTRELHDQLRCEAGEKADCIRALRRESAALSQEVGAERHECAAHLELASQLRAAGLEAGAREQRLEAECAGAAGQARALEELRLREASQQVCIRDLQGALERQRLQEASEQARAADAERALERQLLVEASQQASLRGLEDATSRQVRELASQKVRIDELERERELMLQERAAGRQEEASLREHQRHLEDASAERQVVILELQCELDRHSEHSALQQTRMKGLEATLTQEVSQQTRASDLEGELERRSEQCALQQGRLAELEDALSRHGQQDQTHQIRIGELELELERLRRQESAARAQALCLESATAEQSLRGTSQQAQLQGLQQELERHVRQEALEQARARELDDARQACVGEMELELQRLRQQEAALQASVWHLEDAASQQSVHGQSQQALVQELRQLELAQQTRLGELESAAEQRRRKDVGHQSHVEELALKLERQVAKEAAQHARMEELERTLEQALLKEKAQQARAAQLEDRAQESAGAGTRLLQCEERLAELEQELVDTRGMHHWQRARQKEHAAELERKLADVQQARGGGATGGLEGALEAEVAEARAELELRRERQLRQLQRAEELQRAGLRRGLAAQAQVDIFERLLRELEAGLPHEACAPAPVARAAAAPGAGAPQRVAVVEAPTPVHEPIGRVMAPLPGAPALVALRAPPMRRPASPLRLVGLG